ncbi:metal ABC transporter ATP-binding protein [Oscillospiraceae bacterium MB08-C2-2]|nr:metal ABC transporter ATP-binding protein [Oscillospiraceae bacterium MB08-C2-2]
MQPVVNIEKVSFDYSGRSVLEDIDLALYAGDFAALIGSNGAGKSTLFKLILGELTPKAGHISILGQDTERFHDWPKIGYVPQSGLSGMADFPATALELVQANLYAKIGFLRRATRQHRELALEALEKVGMRDYAGRMIGQLSGGQQQRVLIARVLVNNPAVLLLDEPVTGMDDNAARQLYALLQELNRQEGLTILMVTHDLEKGTRIAGRVFCLECGSVVELSRDQLEHELSHRHTHPQREGECNA